MEIKEEKIDTTKHDNDILEIMPTGMFLDKSELTEKDKYEILSVDKHNFKPNLRSLSVKSSKLEGRINLNTTNQNKLIAAFTGNTRNWVGKVITMWTEKYQGNKDVNEGYSLHISIDD